MSELCFFDWTVKCFRHLSLNCVKIVHSDFLIHFLFYHDIDHWNISLKMNFRHIFNRKVASIPSKFEPVFLRTCTFFSSCFLICFLFYHDIVTWKAVFFVWKNIFRLIFCHIYTRKVASKFKPVFLRTCTFFSSGFLIYFLFYHDIVPWKYQP